MNKIINIWLTTFLCFNLIALERVKLDLTNHPIYSAYPELYLNISKKSLEAGILEESPVEIWAKLNGFVKELLESNVNNKNLLDLSKEPTINVYEILDLIYLYGENTTDEQNSYLLDLLFANVFHGDLVALRILHDLMIAEKFFSAEGTDNIRQIASIISVFPTNETLEEELSSFTDGSDQEHDILKLIKNAQDSPDRKTLIEDDNSWYLYHLGLSYLKDNPIMAELYLKRSANHGHKLAKLQVKIFDLNRILKLCKPYLAEKPEALDLYLENLAKIELNLNNIKKEGSCLEAFHSDLVLFDYFKTESAAKADQLRASLIKNSVMGLCHVMDDLDEALPSDNVQSAIFFKALEMIKLGQKSFLKAIKDPEFKSPSISLYNLVISGESLKKNISENNLKECHKDISDIADILFENKKHHSIYFFKKINFLDILKNLLVISKPEKDNDLALNIANILMFTDYKDEALTVLEKSSSRNPKAKFLLACLMYDSVEPRFKTLEARQEICELLEDSVREDDSSNANALYLIAKKYDNFKQHLSEDFSPEILADKIEKKISQINLELSLQDEPSKKLNAKVLQDHIDSLTIVLFETIMKNNLHLKPKCQKKFSISKVKELLYNVKQKSSNQELIGSVSIELAKIFLSEQNFDDCQEVLAGLPDDNLDLKELKTNIVLAKHTGAKAYASAMALKMTNFVSKGPNGTLLKIEPAKQAEFNSEIFKDIDKAALFKHPLAMLQSAIWYAKDFCQNPLQQSLSKDGTKDGSSELLKINKLVQAILNSRKELGEINPNEEFKKLEAKSEKLIDELYGKLVSLDHQTNIQKADKIILKIK